MKYSKKIIIPLVIVVMISLGGCKVSTNKKISSSMSQTEESTLTIKESTLVIETNSFTKQQLSSNRVVPKLEVLSDNSLEGNTYFNWHYDKIIFHEGGKEQEIKPNNSKFIRMLNFVGLAIETKDYVRTQGQVDKEYYEKNFYKDKYFELIIDEEDIQRSYYTKYIINDCGFLGINDHEENIDVYEDDDFPPAYWFEPYAESTLDGSDGFNHENLLSYCGW